MNPISESEMREYFERIVSNFVSLSDQARELEALKNTVTTLRQQVEAIVEDNNRLKVTISDLQSDLTHEAQSHETTQRQRDSAESEVRALRESIVSRDQKVSELEVKLRDVSDKYAKVCLESDERGLSISNLTAQRDTAVTESEQRGETIYAHVTTINSINERVTNQNHELNEAYSENNRLRSELENTTKMLEDIRRVLSRVENVVKFDPIAEVPPQEGPKVASNW
jgi:chromosome segregation ATPase